MFKDKNNLKAWLYLFPTLLLLGVFVFYPLFNTFIMAFLEDYNYLDGSSSGFGLANFKAILSYEKFWNAIINTTLIVFISVPLSVVVSLLIAVALNSIKVFQKFFQIVFFLPYVTNVIAIGMVFSVMFHSNYGLVNEFLSWFGIDAIEWLSLKGNIWGGRFVIILYGIWSGLAFKILIFMSGLQSIGRQYYQAAKIDATPKWRVLRRVTVPLLSPMILYVTITSFIAAFKTYASVVAIVGAGPQAERYGTIVWFIYRFMGNPEYFGRAAAAALLLFVVILIFTGVNLYFSKKRVHY
ncbi:sugar ABC transporter permease [Mycoplasmatota bacterium WC44]